LRKSPAFTLVAVLTLTIGIGATTTVFSLINRILLRRLPYPDQDRLVALSNIYSKQPGFSAPVSATDVAHWRAESEVFEKVEFVSRPDITAMSSAGSGERVGVQHMSAQLLPLLGIKSLLGTFPTDETTEQLGALGALISYEFWKHHFGGDPNVLGRTIFVDTFSVPILAVLEPGFDFFETGTPEIYLIDGIGDGSQSGVTDARWLFAVGKLKRGGSLQQAQAAMNVTAQHLAQVFPEAYKDVGVRVEPLQKRLFGDWVPQMYYTLFGVAGLVLMIACANVANLLLVRGEVRRKEIGVRVALGATLRTLVRQVLTESIVLSLIGGAAGLALSLVGVRILNLLAPFWFPRATGALVDGWVLLYSFSTCLLAGIAFGLIPACRAMKTDFNDLKEGGRGLATISRHRTRNTLVVAEVALALVLLICAGLMINTLTRILRTKPGFNPEHLLTVEVRLTGDKYIVFHAGQVESTDLNVIRAPVEQFYQHVLEHLRNLPGVDGVAMIDWLPLVDSAQYATPGFTTVGQSVSNAAERPSVLRQAVSSDYFRLMAVPIVRGRGVTQQDTESNAWVVVINEAMARRFWPNEDPVGKLITFDDSPEEKPRQIVGIVGNVKQFELTLDSRPEAYVGYHQMPTHIRAEWTESRIHKSLVIRTHFASKPLMQNVRRTISELAPESAVFGVAMVEQTVSNSAALWRFLCEALELFSAIALVLAVIGIYGVISYSVRERSHDLALRMAFGAHPRQVLGLVLRQAMMLSLIGVVIGLAGSFAVTPLIAKFLYGVKAHDVVNLLLVSSLLMSITFVASYVPARYVTNIDPMRTLRHE
jgi:putative ABC transport system permease protein